jgi:hypothetical protein
MKEDFAKRRETGIEMDMGTLVPTEKVELFGHVNLVEGYDLPSFNGCHALVALRDTPGKT